MVKIYYEKQKYFVDGKIKFYFIIKNFFTVLIKK